MVECVLKIELLSDTCFSRGDGIAGVVDTTVVSDRYGLPEIPAKTVKGLLREVALDVLHAFSESTRTAWFGDKNTDSLIDDLFGKAGEEKSAPLQVKNGRLDNFDTIHAWLRDFNEKIKRDKKDFPLDASPRNVLELLTTDRSQTSRDRDKFGAAKEDTLRRTRFVLKDLTFNMPIKIEGTEYQLQERLRLLALSAAALQRAGLSRNRGPGHVRCSVYLGDVNVTKKAIEDLKKTDLAAPEVLILADESSHSISDAIDTSYDGEPCEITYHVTLHELVLIPQDVGDPNETGGFSHLPGSVILAAMAHWYLQSNNVKNMEAVVDEVFQNFFLRGVLRFLPAYPEFDPQGQKIRTLPIPNSIHHEPIDDIYYDFLPMNDEDEKQNLDDGFKPASPQYCTIDSTGMKLLGNPQMRVCYHHQRSKNRYVGRAQENDGALFTYTALEPDQCFQGKIIGNKNALESFLRAMKWPTNESLTLQLGRSRHAQYGGEAEIRLADPTTPIVPFQSEISIDEDSFFKNMDQNDELFLLFTSPLLMRNEQTGEPGMNWDQLKKTLNPILCEKGSLKVDKIYSRYTRIGGFSSVAGFPLPFYLALDAGTVIRLKPNEEVTLNDRLQAEWNSIGERTAEGFGRFVIGWNLPECTANGKLSHVESKPHDNRDEPPENIKILIRRLLCKHLKEQVLLKAMKDAEKYEPDLEHISLSLLGRLEMMYTKGNVDEKTRKKAPEEIKKHLEKPISEHISFIVENNGNIDWEEINEIQSLTALLPNDYECLKSIMSSDNVKQLSVQEIKREYYTAFFSVLRKQKKISTKTSQTQNDQGNENHG